MSAMFLRASRSRTSPLRSPDARRSAPPRQPQLGNQHLQHLLRRAAVQAKLTVNEPGDRYEQEADRMADQVMRMAEPAAAPAVTPWAASGVQRKCAACAAGGGACPECAHEENEEEKAEKPVQRQESAGPAPDDPAAPPASPIPPGGGRPLPAAARAFFEPRFGRDFGDVRVHTGDAADASARGFQALAYTHGRDIVFRSGELDPGSAAGRRLLAHELTHVIQQDRGAGSVIQRKCGSKSMGDCTDEDLMTAVCIGEAGNIKDSDGQQGVMNVVQNRAGDSAFGGGVRAQSTAILNAEPHSPPAVDRLGWTAYSSCRPLAQKVLAATAADPTLGALFFDQCCERRCEQFCTGYLGDGSSRAHYYARRATPAETAACNATSKNSASCTNPCGTGVNLAHCDKRCCTTGRTNGAPPTYPGLEEPKPEAPQQESAPPETTQNQNAEPAVAAA